MNKQILVGSIIAVAILILVSFSGVVGYQTTSTTIARASPLFSLRSKRAIDEESKDITCDYVGKGEESVLSIPKRDDRTDLQQKLMDMISKMDDKTFNRFIGSIINRMEQNGHKDIDNADIVNALNQLRTNQYVKDILLKKSDNLQLYRVEQVCVLLNIRDFIEALLFLISVIVNMILAIPVGLFYLILYFNSAECLCGGTL